jgi:hypothetical protein
MHFTNYKQRFYATLFILGAGFFLFRTINLLSQGVLEMYVLWVSILLFVEMIIDAGCIITSIPWWIANDKSKNILPLNFIAAAIIVHAIRVLIFVLGRTGPWINFDIRPEERALYDTRWTWGDVYIAGTLSALSVIVVIIIWLLRKRTRKIL